MALKVLESWRLLAYLEGEPTAEQVEQLLLKAEAGVQKLLLSVVHWGEIYYHAMREVSQEAAERTAKEIADLTIEMVGVDDKDLGLARQAALCKAARKFSYAAAFAAALAKTRNAELVSGDREWKQVADETKIARLGRGPHSGIDFHPSQTVLSKLIARRLQIRALLFFCAPRSEWIPGAAASLHHTQDKSPL